VVKKKQYTITVFDSLQVWMKPSRRFNTCNLSSYAGWWSMNSRWDTFSKQCRQDYPLGEALGNPLPQPWRVKIWPGERELNERFRLDTYDNRDNKYNEKIQESSYAIILAPLISSRRLFNLAPFLRRQPLNLCHHRNPFPANPPPSRQLMIRSIVSLIKCTCSLLCQTC
jgi:hypothetical protein